MLAPRAVCVAARAVAPPRCSAAGWPSCTATPCARFHASSRRAARRRPELQPFAQFVAPSDAAAAAILDARRTIFGIVPGTGARSGRKVLRSRSRGPRVSSWYPLDLHALGLDSVGLDPPIREELYRREQQDNRIGKSRVKGKLRRPTAAFVERMKLVDGEEGMLDGVDYFYPEDVLPDERVVEGLMTGLDDAGVAMLQEVWSEMAVMAEEGRLEKEEKPVDAASEKASRARDKAKLRRSLADKRLKEDDTGEAGATDASSSSGAWFSPEELEEIRAAALAAGYDVQAPTAASSAAVADAAAGGVVDSMPAAAAAVQPPTASSTGAADAPVPPVMPPENK